MASLGDLFPKGLKDQIITGNLKVGSVFRIFDNTTKPPKIKRFIVVGLSQDNVMFATVFINTEINPNMFPTPELQALHLPLDINGRPYLDHSSYVDCSQIFEKKVEEVKSAYENDMQSHLGDLATEDLKAVKGIIKNTRTISVKKKKEYGLFL